MNTHYCALHPNDPRGFDAHGNCRRCAGIQAAERTWEQIIGILESMPDDEQTKVIECGMRLRELACFYGPYFTLAIALTSAEIGAERLIMPTEAACDNVTDLLLPGGAKATDVKEPVKIIIPGNDTKN